MNIQQITGLILAAGASFAMAEEPVKSPTKVARKTEPATAIEPYALQLMKSSSDFLAATKQFSVSAEIWQELEDENGNLLQFSKNIALKVHRPNKLRVDVAREVPSRSFYYNGKTLTVLDHKTGYFGQVEAPDNTDAMIERADKFFAITLPLEDLVLSKPFGRSSQKAKAAQYLGKENVLGVSCHHMAFQSDTIQWQTWIDDGVLPLPRKLVIIFQEEEGAPRFTALFKDWDVTTPLGDHLFDFTPPPGVTEIPVIDFADEKPSPKK